MENVRYTAKRLAEIVGATEKQVASALGRKDGFGMADLPVLREKLKRMPEPYPHRIQLFLNFKGGTGKTSLSTSYAYRLAERGYRVLMIDLDSQGHATKCLGQEGSSFTRTLHEVLIRKVPIDEVTVPTGMPNLSLVPANLAMSTIDLALMPLAGREFRLRNALQGTAGRYDFIVLDAPPSFGLLNLNALMAATDLVIPVLADFLSYDGLRLLFETIQGLEQDLSHQLENIFIVVNAYNQTFKIAREALGALREHYADYLLDTVVRQCTKFAQASSEGCPIFGYDADSKGATDLEAVQTEILGRVKAAAAATGAAGA
ncbi:Cobyrinic acid ac-diamide synthase [Anaeromyxobacter dehalogenans 2CP-1]|uniref:Cobyrinic acid ac-diamide synthase n=1 Tax=Anaeromyxobacter dehalogenans (strain ATCC BAA-258 / DSM 21875 / 2CP-1) TaxID=455488 RepID=B8J8L1_ANAD2|nr:ParA family protein [Anaeromyxobacter dehalogenans]ACL67297.1 Cobyrinic acid ac-diamide synthase [Anaeromyxobacter dehalogenans 2CP-1]